MLLSFILFTLLFKLFANLGIISLHEPDLVQQRLQLFAGLEEGSSRHTWVNAFLLELLVALLADRLVLIFINRPYLYRNAGIFFWVNLVVDNLFFLTPYCLLRFFILVYQLAWLYPACSFSLKPLLQGVVLGQALELVLVSDLNYLNLWLEKLDLVVFLV